MSDVLTDMRIEEYIGKHSGFEIDEAVDVAHDHENKELLDTITNLGTVITKDVGVDEGHVPVLGPEGKLAESMIPAVAITDTHVVESEAEMLALEAERGDVAVRTDLSKSYVLQAAPASELANWVWLQNPECLVSSVAGRTGDVVIDVDDVQRIGTVATHDVGADEGDVPVLDAAGELPVKAIPTLTLSKISDSGTAAARNVGTAEGNVPVLGSGGKLAVERIPNLTLSKITDAGTAALRNTGTAEGQIPVLGAGGELSAQTISTDGVVKAGRTFYNVADFEIKDDAREIVIYTKIPFVARMPLVHIKGYAYEAVKPIDLKIAFYSYPDVDDFVHCTATTSGGWKPDICLFAYTDGNAEYAAIGLMPTADSSFYYTRFAVDLYDSWKDANNYSKGWTTDYVLSSDTTGRTLILDKRKVLVPYTKIQLEDISGLGTVASKNTGTAAGNIPVVESSGKLPTAVIPADDNKVDKVTGKGLSTNDYTTAEKTKLAGIAAGANNYTHPATHPASMITGLPTALPADGGTADKVKNKLTAGSKTYDGSAAVTLTAADLGALTSIPATYVTETEYATASKGGVVKSSTAADKVKVETDGTMSLNGVSGGKVSGAVANATSATTATTAASANKVANKLTAGSKAFDGSSAVTITAADVGAAATSHTHVKSQITDFPSSLPANGGTADKVGHTLTLGNKVYDGSAEVTITASELGAITTIPAEYVTETEYATANKGGVVKSSTAANKVSVGTDGTMTINTVNGSKISGAVASATSATTATKLSTNAGSATQPVYFSDGKPVETTYTLGASVPSNAKFTDTTYSAATPSASGLMSGADKTKVEATNVAYGTCSTAAATAAKVVTLSNNVNWKLVPGSMVTIKFTYTNTAANPTLNVNGTGAKPVWVNTVVITTTSLGYAGTANRPINYIYDGTQYVFIGWSVDTNTTYATMTAAEATTGTATTARTISAKVLHDKIEAMLSESLNGSGTGQTWHAKDILGSGTTSTADATAESGYSVTIDTTAKSLNGSTKKYTAPFGAYVAIFRVQASTVSGSADKVKLEMWGASAAIASRAVKLSDFSAASKWEYFKIPFETDSTSGRDIYPKVTCLNTTGNVKVDNIVVVPNAFALM